MKAITIDSPGGPDVLVWSEVPDAEAAPGEVLIDVAAAGVNRADIMQRQGHYPPPPGASDYLGLECSGRISALGQGVAGWSVGDEVCALLAGGGYAEKVAVPATQILPVPTGVSLVEAAALVEVASTVWSNVFAPVPLGPGHLVAGETLLVHGGSSGIGTMAIQLAVAMGNPVLVTVGTAAKAKACLELGATAAINYKDEDFVARAKELTGGRGGDVILDNMGAKYLARNIDALAPDGRLVTIGMQGGAKGELDFGLLLSKRASVAATGLRSRPVIGASSKADVVAGVLAQVWPLVDSGAIKAIIDRLVPIADARSAHERMESSEHIGKILLTVN